MSETYDLIVIGGGPAGTAAAMVAARAGASVLLLERGRPPRQKVCGEFVSAEGVETLRGLDAAVADRLLAGAPRIGRSRLFSDGQCVEVPVEPAAASVTRFELDFALWRAAEKAGAECRQAVEVESVTGEGPLEISLGPAEGGCATQAVLALSVIDASGRWSKLRASEVGTPSRQPRGRRQYIGLKAHFGTAEADGPTVDLYFFEGGYCGVQPIGDGQLNACAMVRADVAANLEDVFASHPALEERSREWQQVGEAVATSPLVFERPRPVRGRVLCAGDAAGFVDPFVGDGITLALRSGVLAAEAALRHDPPWYEREYRARLAPVFGNASWLRRVMALPAVLRKPMVNALRAPLLGRMIVSATRAR